MCYQKFRLHCPYHRWTHLYSIIHSLGSFGDNERLSRMGWRKFLLLLRRNSCDIRYGFLYLNCWFQNEVRSRLHNEFNCSYITTPWSSDKIRIRCFKFHNFNWLERLNFPKSTCKHMWTHNKLCSDGQNNLQYTFSEWLFNNRNQFSMEFDGC